MSSLWPLAIIPRRFCGTDGGTIDTPIRDEAVLHMILSSMEAYEKRAIT
jgi:hypothetical protein